MSTAVLIKKTARLLEKRTNDILRPHRITHGFMHFLMALYEQNGMNQTELQKVVEIEQPTVVRTLDRMARNGLIVRRRCPTDRRVFNIFLTERGTACKSAVLACSAELNRILLLGLEAGDKEGVHQQIKSLLLNLEVN